MEMYWLFKEEPEIWRMKVCGDAGIGTHADDVVGTEGRVDEDGMMVDEGARVGDAMIEGMADSITEMQDSAPSAPGNGTTLNVMCEQPAALLSPFVARRRGADSQKPKPDPYGPKSHDRTPSVKTHECPAGTTWFVSRSLICSSVPNRIAVNPLLFGMNTRFFWLDLRRKAVSLLPEVPSRGVSVPSDAIVNPDAARISGWKFPPSSSDGTLLSGPSFTNWPSTEDPVLESCNTKVSRDSGATTHEDVAGAAVLEVARGIVGLKDGAAVVRIDAGRHPSPTAIAGAGNTVKIISEHPLDTNVGLEARRPGEDAQLAKTMAMAVVHDSIPSSIVHIEYAVSASRASICALASNRRPPGDVSVLLGEAALFWMPPNTFANSATSEVPSTDINIPESDNVKADATKGSGSKLAPSAPTATSSLGPNWRY